MKYFLLTIFLLAQGPYVFADANTKYAIHHCMLLPITGDLEAKEKFEIYSQLEQYLKKIDWCNYKTNSEILTILQNHKKNLAEHLDSPEVLQVVANKTKAGALIRPHIKKIQEGTEIVVRIMGDNGRDVFFNEKVKIIGSNPELIKKTITNWLEVYEKIIPYDGRVLGVLGDRFTIDLGRATLPAVGSTLRAVRPIGKKGHPLLREIVEWETKILGDGQIISSSNTQSQGEMTSYATKEKLRPGDWIIIKKKLDKKVKNTVNFPEVKAHQFGQLGMLSIGGILGYGQDTTNISNIGRRIGGFLAGGYFKGELWATRHFLGLLELGKNLGFYTRQQGPTVFRNVGLTQNIFKIKLGYRYLPMGFFLGPQIDIYIGHGDYSYELDLAPQNGLGHHQIKGFLMGIKGSLPFHRLFRGILRLDFLTAPKYGEKTAVFGTEAKTTTSYQIEFGASYNYSPLIIVDGSIEITSNRATFAGDNAFHFNETAFKGGVSFVY